MFSPLPLWACYARWGQPPVPVSTEGRRSASQTGQRQSLNPDQRRGTRGCLLWLHARCCRPRSSDLRARPLACCVSSRHAHRRSVLHSREGAVCETGNRSDRETGALRPVGQASRTDHSTRAQRPGSSHHGNAAPTQVSTQARSERNPCVARGSGSVAKRSERLGSGFSLRWSLVREGTVRGKAGEWVMGGSFFSSDGLRTVSRIRCGSLLPSSLMHKPWLSKEWSHVLWRIGSHVFPRSPPG
jgi:hypothetical protein